MTVFHNLCRDYHEITAPPLDCARSGYLHTICSVVTKEKISSLRLRLLSQQYLAKFSHRKDLTALPSHQQHLQLLRPQATPVQPASAGFTPANCTGPSASAGFLLLQITPVPSGFHAVVRILNILHGVRARFIWRLHAAFSAVSQIQNRSFVSHAFLTFPIDTRQYLAASTSGKLAATIRKLQLDKLIGGRRSVPFKNKVESIFFDSRSASLCSPGRLERRHQ